LADLAEEPFVDDQVRRFGHQLLLARRTLIEASIAVGRDANIIGELESLIEAHPLDESLVGLSMTALHRSGRTADALRAYADLRVRLSSELGIEPSTDLKRLEQELLDSDVTLTSSARGHRTIPRTPTSFRGRTTEIAGIESLLSDARIVTICGFGGLGKTRLAQEIAARQVDEFADGVWFVDLTDVDDPDLLAERFAVAGGIPGAVSGEPVARLLRTLGSQHVLVVVDNCEHLIDDVGPLLTRIAAHASDVHVLTTSRVALEVPGEAVWALQPLESESSVQVFADRARLANPAFEADTGVVEQLCSQLDGIPLAIEMAAARTSMMSIDQMP
jgi:hypothetical protein